MHSADYLHDCLPFLFLKNFKYYLPRRTYYSTITLVSIALSNLPFSKIILFILHSIFLRYTTSDTLCILCISIHIYIYLMCHLPIYVAHNNILFVCFMYLPPAHQNSATQIAGTPHIFNVLPLIIVVYMCLFFAPTSNLSKLK